MLCSSVRVTAPRSWSFSKAPGSDSQPAMNTFALFAAGGAFVAAGAGAGFVAAAVGAAVVDWGADPVVAAAGAGADVAAGTAVGGGADCEHAASRTPAQPARTGTSKARRLSKRFNLHVPSSDANDRSQPSPPPTRAGGSRGAQATRVRGLQQP